MTIKSTWFWGRKVQKSPNTGSPWLSDCSKLWLIWKSGLMSQIQTFDGHFLAIIWSKFWCLAIWLHLWLFATFHGHVTAFCNGFVGNKHLQFSTKMHPQQTTGCLHNCPVRFTTATKKCKTVTIYSLNGQALLWTYVKDYCKYSIVKKTGKRLQNSTFTTCVIQPHRLCDPFPNY